MGEQSVSHLVPRTVSSGFLRHARRYARIKPVLKETGYHDAGACRVVSCVAIDQNIQVGIDVGEHSPYYVPLALMHFTPHQCPSGTSDLDRPVGRIVVVNVDRGFGQCSAEIGDHLGDGRFLVEAGYQDCHPLLERAAQSVGTSRRDLALGHQSASSATADTEVPLLSPEYQPRLCTSAREYKNRRGISASAVELHDRSVRKWLLTAGVTNRHSPLQCNRLGRANQSAANFTPPMRVCVLRASVAQDSRYIRYQKELGCPCAPGCAGRRAGCSRAPWEADDAQNGNHCREGRR